MCDFLDFFCCTQDSDRKILIFFQWGNTPPHQCCVFHSSFRLLLLFLAPGLHFVPVIRLLFPDQSWRAGGRRRCCLHYTAEEHEAVSDPCPVLHLHGGECTHLGLAFPTSRKRMNDKGLFLDVSGCCQGKDIMLVLYYCYHCDHEPRYIMRIKVRSKTALTWGPAKQNCNVFPLSLCTRVCCALRMYLCYHQCRYTNRPRVRLHRLCEEVLYLMGCFPCKAST